MQQFQYLAIFLAISLFLVGDVFADNRNFIFRASASGSQEVSPPAPLNGVETETTGTIRLDFNRALSKMDFVLRVRNGVAITQAHLHCGRAGENGPVVAFLFGFVDGGVDVDGRLSSGILTNADITDIGADCIPTIGRPINNIASLLSAVLDGLVYMNVHSVANPPGEVRAQILDE